MRDNRAHSGARRLKGSQFVCYRNTFLLSTQTKGHICRDTTLSVGLQASWPHLHTIGTGQSKSFFMHQTLQPFQLPYSVSSSPRCHVTSGMNNDCKHKKYHHIWVFIKVYVVPIYSCFRAFPPPPMCKEYVNATVEPITRLSLGYSRRV